MEEQPFSSADLDTPPHGFASSRLADRADRVAGLYRWPVHQALDMEQTHSVAPSNQRLVRRLLLLVAAAFAFAFALVPLYNVLCEATGFNGKTAGQKPNRDGFGVGGLKTESTPAANVDVTRKITVEFTGTVMPGLPWDMRPLTLTA